MHLQFLLLACHDRGGYHLLIDRAQQVLCLLLVPALALAEREDVFGIDGGASSCCCPIIVTNTITTTISTTIGGV